MRGADPVIVLVPGVGMFSFGPDASEARIAGEFYVNAINVMRGAEAVSTYAPIDEAEKFRIEYWELEEAKLRRLPPPKPLAGRVAFVTGAASGIGKAIAARLAARGRRGRGRRPRRRRGARRGRGDGGRRHGDRGRRRRRRRGGRGRRDPGGVRHLRRRRPGGEQRRPVDLQAAARDDDGRLGPPARGDGPGLVPGQPGGGPGDGGAGARRRHRLRRVEERGGRRHRTTSPTARPRPTRPTRSGCSPPSWARSGSGSTASTPTASCGAPASSRAAGATSGPRSTACPARSSAGSTPGARCSGTRCCPSTSPRPCSPCVAGDLALTTGTIVPVDGGVPMAFLR